MMFGLKIFALLVIGGVAEDVVSRVSDVDGFKVKTSDADPSYFIKTNTDSQSDFGSVSESAVIKDPESGADLTPEKPPEEDAADTTSRCVWREV